MKVITIFDRDESEYISFISGTSNIQGYGETEVESLYNFLYQCQDNPLFNKEVISELILKLESQ